MRSKPVLKRIYLRTGTSKRPVYEVLYEDGRRMQTAYIEIHGPSTLRYDKALGRYTIETRANISLGTGGACVICGEDMRDKHVHA